MAKTGWPTPFKTSLLWSGLQHCDALFNLSLISAQGYAPACHCDGLVEVVGLQGVMHLVRTSGKILHCSETIFCYSTSLYLFQHL